MSLVGNIKPPSIKMPGMGSGANMNFTPYTSTPYVPPKITSTYQYQAPATTKPFTGYTDASSAGGYGTQLTRDAVAKQLGIDDHNALLNDYTSQYNTMMKGDETYNSQFSGLNSALTNAYDRTVLDPARQAEIAYGGTLPETDAAGGKIDYSGYASPKDLYGNSFSQSLVSALNDSKIADNARANPYSDLAMIQQQLNMANQGSDADAVARGGGFSGLIGQGQNLNAQTAGQARYSAQNNFLNALTGANNNWLGQLSGASDKVAGFQGDLASRVFQLINAGILSARNNPNITTSQAALGAPPGQTRGPSGSGVETPQGMFDYGIFGEPDLSGNESAAGLQQGASPYQGQENNTEPWYGGSYGPTTAAPTAVNISANKSGGSANKKQGVFSIH